MRSNSPAPVPLRSLLLLPLLFLGLAAKPAPSDLPPPVPPFKDQPIDAALQAKAMAEIQSASVSSDPILRVHAVEAYRRTLGSAAKVPILKALDDVSPLVRFGALMACGDLRLPDALAAARRLADDPDGSVRVAARFALHRLGDTRLSHELEKTALDPAIPIRRNTALVLGLLGEPSAVKILRAMEYDDDPGVRQQVAEALWLLGDQKGLEHLVALSLSAYPDEQMVALLALAGPRDRRARGHLQPALTSPYTEVALVAARAIGLLGSDEGYGVALAGAKSSDPRQQALAALAFGAIGRSDAQPVLAQLIAIQDRPDVRLMAATALLQIAGQRGQR